MSRAWYSYNGSGDVGQTDSYLYTRIVPTCRDGRRVCAIYGLYALGSTHPQTISQNLSDYIAAGQATGNAQPQTPVGAKKYAYFLPL